MKIKSASRPRKSLPVSGVVNTVNVIYAGVLCLCLASGTAWAHPRGESVAAGTVSFSRQGNIFTITNSPGAIINWSSFSIPAGQMVKFIQESSKSTVLNRVTGQDPTQILGALQSNGRVFLINPNGIVFGAGSQVNTAGLVASTLNISNADFLAGKNHFNAGNIAGDLNNQGVITTPAGGQVFLIAPNVTNTGIITSPQGEVLLAAGHSVQLADSANPSLHVVVSSPADQAINLGLIIAQGSKVGIYGALVNQRGTINANSAAVGENGKIVLRASRTALLEAGSSTTATGTGNGGEIQVLGEQVGLTGNALIDVSGRNGGGTALIGGDYQGKNPDVMNAQQVFIDQDAKISADAIVRGNGGKVIVWGKQTAQAYGAISVRGGSLSGNGGFIETSGHTLDVNGIRIDAGAAHGNQGKWLLDPENITINNDGPTPLGSVAAFSSLPESSSEVNSHLLSNATADVVLQATNNIVFDIGPAISNANAGVSLTAQAGGNITVNTSLHFAGNITLSANDNGAGTASGSGVVIENVVATAGGTKTIIDINRPVVTPPPPPPPPPPPSTPTASTPPPSADICSIAPDSALCQVLSPPTASEPVKPVQQASNEVIRTIAASTSASTPPPDPKIPAPDKGSAASDDSKSEKSADKTADSKELASNDKPGTKNDSVKKMYCN